MDIIVGTAGHIDHGKTALVKALTGTDTDRLPEEKKRGITIDLGFAELESGGVHFGFVDVPGHERFVKNMLAGASGIDLVLLVVAADEGVMPQTREHFDICRLLDVREGVVVLTKRDLVDDEMLELVRLEIAELVKGSFLEKKPVVAVSAKTGEGIDELKLVLGTAAKDADKDVRVPILPIDRVFTMKGFGTVVTGTLASGAIAEGDELDLLPLQRTVRVRGIQSFGETVRIATAGQRTAVNLAGIDHVEIERGMVLTEKGVLRTTQAFDAKIEVLESAKRPLKTRQRVRVHIGSAEVLARIFVLNKSGIIEPDESSFAQLRFEKPVVAFFGERFVIRTYSPQATVAGGRVCDPFPDRHRRSEWTKVNDFLESICDATEDMEVANEFVENCGKSGISIEFLQSATAWSTGSMKSIVEKIEAKGGLVRAGNILIGRTVFDLASENAAAEIERFHRQKPLEPGISLKALRDIAYPGMQDVVITASIESLKGAGKITVQKETVRMSDYNAKLSETDADVLSKLESIFQTAGLEPAKLDDVLTRASNEMNVSPQLAGGIFQVLLNSGNVVKVTDEHYFARAEIAALITKIKAFADGTADRLIDVAKFKELAAVSRKYAIPLLEYFDREKVTVRSGDKRLVL